MVLVRRRRKKLPWRGVLPSLNLLPRVAHGAGAGLDLDASVNYNAKPPPGSAQCCWHLSQALRPHVPHTGAHSIAKTSSELHTNAIWPISELDGDAENIYKNLLRRCTRISDLPTASIKCLPRCASIAHSAFILLLPLYHLHKLAFSLLPKSLQDGSSQTPSCRCRSRTHGRSTRPQHLEQDSSR